MQESLAKQPLLEAQALTVSFGALQALIQVSLAVSPKQIVGVIGPNGAGKSTLFNVLSGLSRPHDGMIRFCGHPITKLNAKARGRLGIARTFQNIRLFKELSVWDNLYCSRYISSSDIAGFIGAGTYKRQQAELKQRCEEILNRFGLFEFRKQTAADLPYGHQRRLEMARALLDRPKLLLLDEPAAGMNPKESRQLVESIEAIKDEFNLGILLIEHDVKLVGQVCQKVFALDAGRVIAEGTPKQVFGSMQVIKAYLG